MRRVQGQRMRVEFCTRSATRFALIPKFKHKSANISVRRHFFSHSEKNSKLRLDEQILLYPASRNFHDSRTSCPPAAEKTLRLATSRLLAVSAARTASAVRPANRNATAARTANARPVSKRAAAPAARTASAATIVRERSAGTTVPAIRASAVRK